MVMVGTYSISTINVYFVFDIKVKSTYKLPEHLHQSFDAIERVNATEGFLGLQDIITFKLKEGVPSLKMVLQLLTTAEAVDLRNNLTCVFASVY